MNPFHLEQFNIRRFIIGDYDALTALWERAGLPYKPDGRDHRDKIANEILRGTAIFLVAEWEHELVGSVLGTHDGRKGWINRLAVDPEYRNRGLAQRLVDAVEQELYKLGIEIIACLIEPENRVSLSFFEKAGYTKFSGVHYLTKRKHSGV